ASVVSANLRSTYRTANSWTVRAALLLATIVTLGAVTSVAFADPKAKPDTTKKADDKPAEPPAQPPPPKPVDPKVQAILDRVAKGDKGALTELDAIASTNLDNLSNFLQRPHVATLEERRAILTTINAQV